MKIVVISRYHPDSLSFAAATESNNGGDPILSDHEERNDKLDKFNHPRFRRAIILRELLQRQQNKNAEYTIVFQVPQSKSEDFNAYKSVQSDGLVDFLFTAWKRWVALGDAGRDPGSSLDYTNTNTNDNNNDDEENSTEPALVPANFVLHRDSVQRSSKNVMGQIGYYCTDKITPVFAQLKEELLWDSSIVQQAVDAAAAAAVSSDDGDDNDVAISYALVTHPGHHASSDCFGGYCYLNHAALAAKLFQQSKGYSKVAVLDVDYHVGNGTAAIFYKDPSVLVVSIHCHPDYDYPFHSGFEDEIGAENGIGTTMHLPLMPQTTWNDAYCATLEKAMNHIIHTFGAEALVISLGLDTHDDDPCAVRRAGFLLHADKQDYIEMGKMIGKACCSNRSSRRLPTVVIQEGGYRMDKVPQAASDVLCGYAMAAAEAKAATAV